MTVSGAGRNAVIHLHARDLHSCVYCTGAGSEQPWLGGVGKPPTAANRQVNKYTLTHDGKPVSSGLVLSFDEVVVQERDFADWCGMHRQGGTLDCQLVELGTSASAGSRTTAPTDVVFLTRQGILKKELTYFH
jgi:hypothetical protein